MGSGPAYGAASASWCLEEEIAGESYRQENEQVVKDGLRRRKGQVSPRRHSLQSRDSHHSLDVASIMVIHVNLSLSAFMSSTS